MKKKNYKNHSDDYIVHHTVHIHFLLFYSSKRVIWSCYRGLWEILALFEFLFFYIIFCALAINIFFFIAFTAKFLFQNEQDIPSHVMKIELEDKESNVKLAIFEISEVIYAIHGGDSLFLLKFWIKKK